jgi:cyanophycinase-like exopeptidase
MALTADAPDPRHPLREPEPGLRAIPHVRVLPHFDRFMARLPDRALRLLTTAPPDVTVLGIDEKTALVGGPEDWEVKGRQSVWTLGPTARVEHPTGSRVTIRR